MGDLEQRQQPGASRPTCPKHPDALVRRFRVDGPAGPTVYLQCVPVDAAPHLLGEDLSARPTTPAASAQTPAARPSPRPGLVARAEVHSMPDAQIPEGELLPFGLTRAELEVLHAAANGLTVPETAAQLQKGAETVKTQRNRIILKIGARNMTHAVCIATEQGLVRAQ
jgi:DNA-binding CsgD family transcriptional regulator